MTDFPTLLGGAFSKERGGGGGGACRMNRIGFAERKTWECFGGKIQRGPRGKLVQTVGPGYIER